VKNSQTEYGVQYDKLLKEITGNTSKLSPRAMSIREIKDHSSVLEFGSASGYITRLLKEEKHCEVYIVEIDQEIAHASIPYAVDFCFEDCENYGWEDKFKDLKFDNILFTDVLEHLKDPWEMLKRIKAFLKPGGSVLISLPNISYKTVLIDLIKFDKFEYAPSGILDNTHLRFFTEKSARSLIEGADFKIAKTFYFKGAVVSNEMSLDELPFFVRAYLKNKIKNIGVSVFFFKAVL